MIAAEHARILHALHTTLGRAARQPAVPRGLDRAPQRRRAGASNADRLSRIVLTTIGGIAAGLQTAG